MKVPKKPSGRRAMPFYWWRRFRSHKNLPYKARLLDKITNGDFDPTPFFQEAEWELHWMKEEQDDFRDNYKGNLDEIEQDIRYLEIELRARKRYNKLYEDGMKDEADRMDRLVNNFSKHFKVNRSKMHDIVYSFDGTILELYRFMQKDLAT
jgi:hypothetical protein|tara:strand:+ start:1230 stop:1682 length:453 start_codon:yes stop_codon:yes gene_type:complete